MSSSYHGTAKFTQTCTVNHLLSHDTRTDRCATAIATSPFLCPGQGLHEDAHVQGSRAGYEHREDSRCFKTLCDPTQRHAKLSLRVVQQEVTCVAQHHGYVPLQTSNCVHACTAGAPFVSGSVDQRRVERKRAMVAPGAAGRPATAPSVGECGDDVARLMSAPPWLSQVPAKR